MSAAAWVLAPVLAATWTDEGIVLQPGYRLANGRVLPAEVLARDKFRALALLKVEAKDLPVLSPPHLRPLSNLLFMELRDLPSVDTLDERGPPCTTGGGGSRDPPFRNVTFT